MSSNAANEQPKNPNEEFFKKREKIYPREVHGLFAKLRTLGVVSLLGLYYFLPWINLGGQQSVLFDLPARKFHVLGLTFWPQDFFYLAVLLIIAALALFFFTTLAGRLWCGYACPQTVWTEAFLWIERKIEGSRQKQIKLDKAPYDARKVRIKVTKHTAWLAFSIWTGFTFVGYFTPIRELSLSFVSFNLGPWETFWIFFYGFATYGNAGWLREQVCIYMCPYARFQSAMFDKDTLIISYDDERGEPRGARNKKVDIKEAGLGSCVDCGLCVQVCPTGIDIREGLQYQCIGCAACIDVCDDVMDKMGYEKGLVRYTTEHEIAGGITNMFRPRIVVYASVIMAIFISLIVAVLMRTPLELDIIRDRNTLYRENQTGMIENVYTLKVINMDDHAHKFNITVSGMDGATLKGAEDVNVGTGEVRNLIVKLVMDPELIPESNNEVMFHIVADDDAKLKQDEHARFLGPVSR